MAERRAHGPTVLLVGDEGPPALVEYEPPEDPADSGYAVVLADAAAVEPDDAIHSACVGCVVARWPDVQTGMTLARRHGTAALDDRGRWSAPRCTWRP